MIFKTQAMIAFLGLVLIGWGEGGWGTIHFLEIIVYKQ